LLHQNFIFLNNTLIILFYLIKSQYIPTKYPTFLALITDIIKIGLYKKGVVMKKLLSLTASIILTVGLLTSCTNREMGTVGGAAIGGVAGSALTGGSALGTVAGAVGGGIIGNQVTK
jgi:osmotically inducible lipoprotein OsmB